MGRRDKIVVAVTIALVASIGGCVFAADDHGQVGAYYYLNLLSDASVNPGLNVNARTAMPDQTGEEP